VPDVALSANGSPDTATRPASEISIGNMKTLRREAFPGWDRGVAVSDRPWYVPGAAACRSPRRSAGRGAGPAGESRGSPATGRGGGGGHRGGDGRARLGELWMIQLPPCRVHVAGRPARVTGRVIAAQARCLPPGAPRCPGGRQGGRRGGDRDGGRGNEWPGCSVHGHHEPYSRMTPSVCPLCVIALPEAYTEVLRGIAAKSSIVVPRAPFGAGIGSCSQWPAALTW
jgi:hypothetical protein